MGHVPIILCQTTFCNSDNWLFAWFVYDGVEDLRRKVGIHSVLFGPRSDRLLYADFQYSAEWWNFVSFWSYRGRLAGKLGAAFKGLHQLQVNFRDALS